MNGEIGGQGHRVVHMVVVMVILVGGVDDDAGVTRWLGSNNSG